MEDVDVLFEVRNFYYLGAYQLCVKEAQVCFPLFIVFSLIIEF